MTPLEVRGARQHNLRDVDLDLPRQALVVITGPSGSGKTSLAIDTIYAEGQRRYVESLSTYARQFLDRLPKPDVDSIEGLSPAICVEQQTPRANPRSTVGTVTEVHDYLRLLFARAGAAHCPSCGRALAAMTVPAMVDTILAWPEGTRLMVLAPLVDAEVGAHEAAFGRLRRDGFVRARLDGQVVDLAEAIAIDAEVPHTLEALVDRVAVRARSRGRLAEAIELALSLGEGVVRIAPVDGEDIVLSERFACPDHGEVLAEMTPKLFSFNSPAGACPRCDGLGVLGQSDDGDESGQGEPCDACHGARLRPEALAVTVDGIGLAELSALPLREARDRLEAMSLPEAVAEVGAPLIAQVARRLGFLVDVGLDYLSLARGASTVSGGEAQRIRLATQIGASLSGVLYVLDEPTTGLHPRDVARLLETLRRLRDHGNTVLLIEHDADAIRAADHVVDMGPGAGQEGGLVVAQGTPVEVEATVGSPTGDFLSGRRRIDVPKRRRRGRGRLSVVGATVHNLRGVDASFPVGALSVVTGVSGSGKSSLVMDTLVPAARARFGTATAPTGASIEGLEAFDRVVVVDATPIGRTPRSSPATYTGLFTTLRELFAGLPEARARGYKAGRFSFNVKGGRCEACQGDGVMRVEMHFLPDVYVRCTTCEGQRYERETLEVMYRGYSIAEVLAMDVVRAAELFGAVPKLRDKLEMLASVGLGYLELGRSATTLSGGEAQRLKLARELGRRGSGRTLYVLDEPTTGLHFVDVARLVDLLHRLVEGGHTVVVVEHDLAMIANADHVVDLGPEGGVGGGLVVVAGTPEQVSAHPSSHTGRHLAETLQGRG